MGRSWLNTLFSRLISHRARVCARDSGRGWFTFLLLVVVVSGRFARARAYFSPKPNAIFGIGRPTGSPQWEVRVRCVHNTHTWDADADIVCSTRADILPGNKLILNRCQRKPNNTEERANKKKRVDSESTVHAFYGFISGESRARGLAKRYVCGRSRAKCGARQLLWAPLLTITHFMSLLSARDNGRADFVMRVCTGAAAAAAECVVNSLWRCASKWETRCGAIIVMCSWVKTQALKRFAFVCLWMCVCVCVRKAISLYGNRTRGLEWNVDSAMRRVQETVFWVYDNRKLSER